MARTGEQTFYKLVGGPDAQIPQTAGLSAATRMIAFQVREACGVKPERIDRETMSLIKDVDAFYGVKPRQLTKLEHTDDKTHSAEQFMEIAAIPEDILAGIRNETNQKFSLAEDQGVVGRIVGGIFRERYAAKATRMVVAAKVKSVFNG
jgi:hypothetical protein